MDKPLVSVCIPTYNNAHYIGKTIRSVINQTYKNIEIIINDNASNDDTAKIVKSFSDNRIRYFRNPETVPCLANWNLCIKLAKANYVAIYHSDDIYEPEIVEKELCFLISHPEVGAVFCLDKIINEKDEFIKDGVELPSEIKNKDTLNFVELFSLLLKKSGSFLVAPSFMAKKEVFNAVGFFDETDRFGDSTGSAADTEMWLRVAQNYKIGIIKERLIRRRISATQGSTQYESTRITRANHFVVLDSFLNSLTSNEKIKKSIFRQYDFNKLWDDVIIAKNLVKQRKQIEAKKLLLKSFSWNRFLTSFKSVKNFVKLMIYYLFMTSLLLQGAQISIKIFQLLKKEICLIRRI